MSRINGAADRAALTAFAVIAAAGLTGCRDDRANKPPRQFFPDMDEQLRVNAQSESRFHRDFVVEGGGHGHGGTTYIGRSMREPVPGTVPFGATAHASLGAGRVVEVAFEGVDFAQRSMFLRDNDAIYRGTAGLVMEAPGQPALDEFGHPKVRFVDRIPIPVTPELLALGESKYNILCIVCHGGIGDGKGLVGVRWSYDLPTFHQEQYYHGGDKGQDGYIFHVIRHGVPNIGDTYELKMPSYASKLNERETWAVVAYVRALQQARNASLDVVPPAERARLERQRGAAMPTPGATPGAGAGAVNQEAQP